MKGISIKGKKLHEISMLMVSSYRQQDSVSYLRYPKSRIHFSFDNNQIVLTTPSMLAVELYRQGIIPQDENESFSVEISGKKVGEFKVVDFRYPDVLSHNDFVKITMEKQK